jgi:hypothetical protein
MLKKILISALIAIGLVNSSIMRAESTSGDMGRGETTTQKHGRGRGFRKKGGEQERPRNTTGTRKGLNPCRRGYTPVDGDIVGDSEDIRINRQPNGHA